MRDTSHLKKQIEKIRKNIEDIESDDGYRWLYRNGCSPHVESLWIEIAFLKREIEDRS
tara:strand:- start:656 stop:829 length:174 start_codon:yes stop_codon:yes gene_type:complete